jgi:hypothetical protein
VCLSAQPFSINKVSFLPVTGALASHSGTHFASVHNPMISCALDTFKLLFLFINGEIIDKTVWFLLIISDPNETVWSHNG